jgi:VanZ family protein
MFQQTMKVVAWSLLGFVVVSTISPINLRPTLHIRSGIEHLAAFAVLGAAFCIAYPRRMGLVCLIVLGSAVLLELVQLLTPDRHARIHDAIVKMGGGVLGIAASRAMLFLDRTNRWLQN